MPQNKKENIEERRKKVAEMYLKGYQQTQIAEVCGVTQGQISQDLKILLEQWKAEQLKNIDEQMSSELSKIALLEQTYWDDYERNDNLAALAGIRECAKMRFDLLGLKAPEKRINQSQELPPITEQDLKEAQKLLDDIC